MRERLEHQDLDDAACPSTCFRRPKETLQEFWCLARGVVATLPSRTGQQQSGEGDVVELAHVAQLVLDGDAMRAGPAQRLAQLPLRDPDPGLHRGDRPDIRVVVARVQPFRLVKELESGVEISFGLPDASHRDAPAIWVLRQTGTFTEVLAQQQVLRRTREIVPLAKQLAHPHVHVRHTAERRRRRVAPRGISLARRPASPRGDGPARSGCRRGRWSTRSRRRGAPPAPSSRRHPSTTDAPPRGRHGSNARAPGTPRPTRARDDRPHR